MDERSTNEYMMLFRGGHWDEGVSAEEVQRRMREVMAWFDGLKESGKVKCGQPLGPDRVTLSGAKRSSVQDGPFVESKEAVGGYLIVHAGSFEEAVSMARSNPTLQYGITIEVRPVLEECPVFERARKQTMLEPAG